MLKNLSSTIDHVTEWVARAVQWLFLFLSFIMCYEVVMRYMFNRPTVWVYDMSYMFGGSAFVLGMGYTLLKKKHVRVDVFYTKFKKRTKALIDIFFTLFVFFPTFGVLLYKMVPWVQESWERQEKATGSFWMPPIYPLKTILLIAIILLLLQAISELIKDSIVLFQRNEEVDSL